jgi:nicotinamide-nucleotide amidase
MTEPELASRVAELLDGRTLACAESCTAGLVAQSFAAVEGSLDWFRGGVVAYQRVVKHELLGVTSERIVTPVAAREMAQGVARLFGTEVAVSTTGAAGPDPLDGAEAGTVIVGTYVDGAAHSSSYFFAGSPAEICEQAATASLRELATVLEAQRPDRLRS